MCSGPCLLSGAQSAHTFHEIHLVLLRSTHEDLTAQSYPGPRVSTLWGGFHSQISRAPLRLCALWSWQAKQRAAFFCSARYSNSGCGRTFSVYWDTVLTHCNLRADALWRFLLALSQRGKSIFRLWRESGFEGMSLTSAYRWVKKWRMARARIRSSICSRGLSMPQEREGMSQDALTLQLMRAFSDPVQICPLACFQSTFQKPLFP